MRRLLALIVLALSLALTSGPAFAVRPDCPMASSSSGMSHQEMDCCKPDCAPICATICPAAVVPAIGGAEGPAEPIQLAALSPAPLHSTDLSETDPPPRTTNS